MIPKTQVKPIFVSSTFKDMHAERDIIRSKVIPALSEFASLYGKCIEMIDLRWGIDTHDISEEESGIKVLRTCFDEIDRSRPYIIVLLGERYGWIPDKNIIKSTKDYVDFDMESFDKSVTAMEIEYGAFNENKKPICYFYFRQSIDESFLSPEDKKIFFDDEESKKKLDELKQLIIEKYPNNIRSYYPLWEEGHGIAGLDDFAYMLTEDLKISLINEWGDPFEENITWQDKEILAMESFMFQKIRRFQGRQSEIEFLINFATTKNIENPLLLLCSQTGLGKSVILSKVTTILNENDCLTLPFFCGITPVTSYVNNMIKIFNYRLCKYLDKNDESESKSIFIDLRDYFFELLEEASKKTRVVLVIDALNQLCSTKESIYMLWLRKDIPQNVCFICSSLYNSSEIEIFGELGGYIKDVLPLSDSDINGIIKSITSDYHKELDKRVLETIYNKTDPNGNRPSQSPLYLTLIIHNLVLMNRYDHEKIDEYTKSGLKADDAIAKYMIELVESSDGIIENVFIDILKRVINLIGNLFTFTALGMIAYSRFGLRETDLEGAFKKLNIPWNQADFSWLRQLLRDYLIQSESGQWNFSHQILSDAMIDLTDDEDVNPLNLSVAVYFMEILDTDEFARREIMYHLWMAEHAELASSCIILDYFKFGVDFAKTLADIENRERDLEEEYHFIFEIIEITKQKPSEENFFNLAQFICKEYYENLSEDTPINYKINILEATIEMLSLFDEKNSIIINFIISSAMALLAPLYSIANKQNDAEKLINIAIDLAEQLANINSDEFFSKNLALIYENAGDLYLGLQKPLKALFYYNSAIDTNNINIENYSISDGTLIKSRLNFKIFDCDKKVNYYDENDDISIDNYDDVLEFEKLTKENDNEESKINQALAYLNYSDQKIKDDLDESEKYLNMAFNIFVEIYENTASTSSMRYLVITFIKIGSLYLLQNDKEQALEVFNEALDLSQTLVKRTNSSNDKIINLDCHYHLGRYYLLDESYIKSENYFLCSIDGFLELYNETNEAEILLKLADCSRNIAVCKISLKTPLDAKIFIENYVISHRKYYMRCMVEAASSNQSIEAFGMFIVSLDNLIDFLDTYSFFKEAIPYLEEKLSFFEMFYNDTYYEKNTKETLEYVDALRELSEFYTKANDYESSNKTFALAIEVMKDLTIRYPSNGCKVTYLMTLFNQADNFLNQGENDQCINIYINSYNLILEKLKNDFNVDFLAASSLCTLGIAKYYKKIDNKIEAKKFYKLSLDDFIKLSEKMNKSFDDNINMIKEELKHL